MLQIIWKSLAVEPVTNNVRKQLEKPQHFHSPDSSTTKVTRGRESQLDRDPTSLLGKASIAFAHDLANPLQVLHILASSSSELLQSEDELLPGRFRAPARQAEASRAAGVLVLESGAPMEESGGGPCF